MVGIVILNYNSIKKLDSCVASVRRHTKCPYCIYIVDNCSTDDSWKYITKHYAGNRDIVAIASERNAGYSAGNNLGLKAAIDQGCEYVMVVNPDVIFVNDVARLLSRTLEQNPVAALAAPYLFEADGKSCGQLFRKDYTFTRAIMNRKPFVKLARNIEALDLRINWNPDMSGFIEGMTSGCCYMFRSSSLQQMDYLDENVFLYHEEFIIADKIKAMNKKVAYYKDAIAIHNHVDASDICTANENLYRYLSALYYLKNYQHCNRLKMTIAYLQNLLLLGIRAIKDEDYKNAFKNYRTYCKNGYKKI